MIFILTMLIKTGAFESEAQRYFPDYGKYFSFIHQYFPLILLIIGLLVAMTVVNNHKRNKK